NSSSCSHHEGAKAKEIREDRLRLFSAEPTRQGNILVQVPYTSHKPRDSKKEMTRRIEEILVPFERR
ncbi:hypothetical protein B0T21DRAFT_278119, partial [Apiosordaria backusii]